MVKNVKVENWLVFAWHHSVNYLLMNVNGKFWPFKNSLIKEDIDKWFFICEIHWNRLKDTFSERYKISDEPYQMVEMFYRSSYFILLSPFYKIYLFGHAIMYKTTYNFFSSQQCNRNKAVKNIGHVKFNFCRIL